MAKKPQFTDDDDALLAELGFEVAMGPEIETDWYNFGVLNFPQDHPARDMQDTFFIKSRDTSDSRVLRTQTTDVTARALEQARRNSACYARCQF